MAENTMVEKIEYLTQIHTSFNGLEQRVCLREFPRRTVTYRYSAMQEWQASWMRAYSISKKGLLVQFPLWHGATVNTKTKAKGDATINIPTEFIWLYRDCSSVILFNDDKSGGGIYDINYISDTGLIKLESQIADVYPAYYTYVVPCFYGYVIQNNNFSNETTSVVDMTISVEMKNTDKSIKLPAGNTENVYPEMKMPYSVNAPKTFNDLELFMYPPQWAEADTLEYDFTGERLDNNTGGYKFYINSNDRKAVRTTKLLAMTRNEGNYLERFFYRCKGMLHSFYMPTWTNDFQLVQSAYKGNKELIVYFNMYYKYYSKNSRRKNICIFFTDNTVVLANIRQYNYTSDGQYGRIVLNEALERDVTLENVRMISFLVCARHNSDTMTIEHETTDISTVTFETTEVNE